MQRPGVVSGGLVLAAATCGNEKLGFSVGRCLYIDIQRLWFIIAHPTVKINGPHRANPFSVPCRVPAHGPNARPRHGHGAGRARHGHGVCVPGPCLGRAFPGRARSGPAGLARLENYRCEMPLTMPEWYTPLYTDHQGTVLLYLFVWDQLKCPLLPSHQSYSPSWELGGRR